MENFQENNIGFICNIDNDIEFVQSIKFFLRMTQNEYDKYISTMSNNVEKLFSESDVIDKSVKLFDEILAFFNGRIFITSSMVSHNYTHGYLNNWRSKFFFHNRCWKNYK